MGYLILIPAVGREDWAGEGLEEGFTCERGLGDGAREGFKADWVFVLLLPLEAESTATALAFAAYLAASSLVS